MKTKPSYIFQQEFPLDSIEIYVKCEGQHSMEHCPSLPSLRAIY